MIKLGVKARDRVTGFEGIVVGHARHITGCDTYGLSPRVKDGKLEEAKWFDGIRLEVIDEGVSAEMERQQAGRQDLAPAKTGGSERDLPKIY